MVSHEPMMIEVDSTDITITALKPTSSQIQILTSSSETSEFSTSMIPQPSVQPSNSPENIQMVQSSFQAIISSETDNKFVLTGVEKV